MIILFNLIKIVFLLLEHHLLIFFIERSLQAGHYLQISMSNDHYFCNPNEKNHDLV